MIRCFLPTLIPGVLQAPDYARAILEVWKKLSPETTHARQELRESTRLSQRPSQRT